jgi:hypothetical protein
MKTPHLRADAAFLAGKFDNPTFVLMHFATFECISYPQTRNKYPVENPARRAL